MVETQQNSFERDVIAASCEVPVLLDFWAPWCGPCRALGPLLERLEQQYDGRFRLVKINSDQNPELAAQFQVRSIPTVMAFVDGQPVDGFVGALPERTLREFIDRLLPSPSEFERRKAMRLTADGDLAGAVAALRAAVALDPASAQAHVDLAELLLERLPAPVDRARMDEAERALQASSKALSTSARWQALDTRLISLKGAAGGPDPAELRARAHAHPDDLQAKLDLAQAYIARREFEAALQQLIEVVERDRAFGDDAGRRAMLAVFELAAQHNPQLVSNYRRRLAAALNR